MYVCLCVYVYVCLSADVYVCVCVQAIVRFACVFIDVIITDLGLL